MSFSFKALLKNLFFYPKWRCSVCGKEVFDDKFFCEDCEKEFPYIEGAICAHCGRKTEVPEICCSTCDNFLVSADKCRSVFDYAPPVNRLIMRFKYGGAKYLALAFAEKLSELYFRNYFNADIVFYIPMTEKAERKRGYNQGRLLAEKLSEIINVPVSHALSKTKTTARQAELNRAERLKNLDGAFKLADKSVTEGKIALIVDDVTTTCATAEAIAKVLKKGGAKAVYVLTVASVSRADNRKNGKRNVNVN